MELGAFRSWEEYCDCKFAVETVNGSNGLYDSETVDGWAVDDGYGYKTGRIVVVGNNKKVGAVSGNTEESNQRKVTMDDDLVKTARSVGINLGD